MKSKKNAAAPAASAPSPIKTLMNLNEFPDFAGGVTFQFSGVKTKIDLYIPRRRSYHDSMSKPVLQINIETPDGKTATVDGVIDSGSFYTILREDRLPAGAQILRRAVPRRFKTAARAGTLTATGEVSLVMTIAGKQIDDVALVSPEFSQDLLVGAGTMQKWDISILNKNGSTEVRVGRDMHDPHVTEVD